MTTSASAGRRLGWGWALGGAFAGMATLLGIAFAYLVVYSYLIHPGASEAYYQDHAGRACPVVCVLAGVPLFFLVGWWIGRRRGLRPLATAFLTWVVFILLDVLILIAAGQVGAGLSWLCGVSYATKLLASLGGAGLALSGGKRDPIAQS